MIGLIGLIRLIRLVGLIGLLLLPAAARAQTTLADTLRQQFASRLQTIAASADGVVGYVVVDLTSATVDHTGCTSGVKKSLIKDIVEHPRRYYVQLHNAKYPTGAIRGTLHR